MNESHPQSYDHYIKALMDISQAVTSDLFLEDVFKLIVMVVAKVTEVDICSLWLVDEDSNPPKIRLKATQAIEPEYVIDRSLNLDEGVVGSGSEIAQRESLHHSTVNELLRLTLLEPAIIQSILAGQQPKCMSLLWFQRNPLPTDWVAQREAVAGFDA